MGMSCWSVAPGSWSISRPDLAPARFGSAAVRRISCAHPPTRPWLNPNPSQQPDPATRPRLGLILRGWVGESTWVEVS